MASQNLTNAAGQVEFEERAEASSPVDSSLLDLFEGEFWPDEDQDTGFNGNDNNSGNDDDNDSLFGDGHDSLFGDDGDSLFGDENEDLAPPRQSAPPSWLALPTTLALPIRTAVSTQTASAPPAPAPAPATSSSSMARHSQLALPRLELLAQQVVPVSTASLRSAETVPSMPLASSAQSDGTPAPQLMPDTPESAADLAPRKRKRGEGLWKGKGRVAPDADHDLDAEKAAKKHAESTENANAFACSQLPGARRPWMGNGRAGPQFQGPSGNHRSKARRLDNATSDASTQGDVIDLTGDDLPQADAIDLARDNSPPPRSSGTRAQTVTPTPAVPTWSMADTPSLAQQMAMVQSGQVTVPDPVVEKRKKKAKNMANWRAAQQAKRDLRR